MHHRSAVRQICAQGSNFKLPGVAPEEHMGMLRFTEAASGHGVQVEISVGISENR